MKLNGTIDAAKSQETLALFRKLEKEGKSNEDILDTLKYHYKDLIFY